MRIEKSELLILLASYRNTVSGKIVKGNGYQEADKYKQVYGLPRNQREVNLVSRLGRMCITVEEKILFKYKISSSEKMIFGFGKIM